MKKILALMLALVMMLSFVACGDNSEEQFGDGGNSDKDTTLTPGDIDDLDDALDALTPEGWDENNYGMYIYDVWDAEFLPDIFPKQVEGTKVSQTNYKDYKHDVLNSNYAVGPIWFDSPENYREYSVSFYASIEQLDKYISNAKAAGFVGDETSSPDDTWREFTLYHSDGWLMYIFFNTNDDDGGDFDGCASVSLTDSLFKRPDSIAGVKLPTAGTPEYDYTAGSCYEVYNYTSDDMETLDVDWNGSFPDNEKYSWYIYFTYYGADVAATKAYKDSLISSGWSVVSERNSEEDEYRSTLRKDDVYMVVNCYNNTHLEIGFADMEENLSY